MGKTVLTIAPHPLIESRKLSQMRSTEHGFAEENQETNQNAIAHAPYVSLKEVSSYGRVGFPDPVWTNMLVLGDNLAILAALDQDNSVRNKVKLVYIDPPFSTGQEFRLGNSRSSTISRSRTDEIAYSDKLAGREYIEFLRKRLQLLRKALAEDGSIYVHVDCQVGHYVKVLMDEIFGERHFINDIARIKCNPKNFPRKGYGNTRDMILFYSKTDDYTWNDPREPFSKEDIERLFPKVDLNGRRYTTNPLHAPGETLNGSTGKQWRGVPPPRGRHWRCSPEVLEQLDGRGLVEWSSKGVPRKKIYADDFLEKGKKKQDVWVFKDPQFPVYPTEKNAEMLKMIVAASSNPEDIVVDAFCGSGATLVAAEQLGRRWIGIDNSCHSMKITIQRLLEFRDCRVFKLFDALR